MKKTKIKQIPMFPTQYYDNKSGWVFLDVLSHADYAGETRWDRSGPDPVTGRRSVENPVMIDNIPWDDVLTYHSYYRGRSAAGCIFTNDLGQRFTVFMTDLDKFISMMIKGTIKGKFIYCKRGQNYGVTLYE